MKYYNEQLVLEVSGLVYNDVYIPYNTETIETYNTVRFGKVGKFLVKISCKPTGERDHWGREIYKYNDTLFVVEGNHGSAEEIGRLTLTHPVPVHAKPKYPSRLSLMLPDENGELSRCKLFCYKYDSIEETYIYSFFNGMKLKEEDIAQYKLG